jgi:NAD+ kinase
MTDYECNQIEASIKRISTSQDLILAMITSNDPFPKDTDLLICFNDSDVLTVSRIYKSLPPTLVVEFPGDSSFFSQIVFDQLEWAVIKFVNKEFEFDQRNLLQLDIEGEESLVALNDIYIASSRVNKRMRYDLTIDGETLNADIDSANSILISTPTGSTAMSLNLGGVIIQPNAQVFQIQSIASRSNLARHQVISNDSIIHVEIIESVLPLSVDVDNYQFTTDKTIFIIKKAEKELNFIKFYAPETSRNIETKLINKISFEDTQSLTSSAKFILHVLQNENKPISTNKISEVTQIKNQKTLRSALNLLMQKGFVRRKANIQDLREYLYYFADNQAKN